MFATYLLLISGVALVTGLPQDAQLIGKSNNDFICPDNFGSYEDKYQCDKYWECDEGIAKFKICEDGLVFDIFKANAGHVDPCESPYVVDCGERLELQEPSFTSEFCPRKHGIFADPDPTVCYKYYTCIGGLPHPTDCANGLHFDETTGNCAWPSTAGRTGCSEKKGTCDGDFCCPGTDVFTADGVKNPHPTYPNLEDCQKFWVCLNSNTPQKSSCSLGYVYNERTTLCDFPENVPECEGWFINHPEFAHYYDYEQDANAADIGNQDTVSTSG